MSNLQSTAPSSNNSPWLKQEIVDTAKLFGPIFLGQIATTATGVVDTVMAEQQERNIQLEYQQEPLSFGQLVCL